MLTRTLLFCLLAFIGIAHASGIYPGGELYPAVVPAKEFQGKLEPALDAGSVSAVEQHSAKIPVTLAVRAPHCVNPTSHLCNSQTYCCRRGYNCCNFRGCCDTRHYCVTRWGRNGCCRNGTICLWKGPGCADAGYTPCEGEDFCCRSGDKCSRDGSGKAVCTPGISAPTVTVR